MFFFVVGNEKEYIEFYIYYQGFLGFLCEIVLIKLVKEEIEEIFLNYLFDLVGQMFIVRMNLNIKLLEESN